LKIIAKAPRFSSSLGVLGNIEKDFKDQWKPAWLFGRVDSVLTATLPMHV
jgi:hypothetical protein